MSFIRRIKKKNGQVYLAEVENKWIDGKSVQKHIRYLGKEVDGETVISLSSKDLQVDSVKIYGPLLVFHSIAKKINLPDILGEYSNEILSMVYAHCMDYKSVHKMPSWYKRTDLNLLLGLDKLTENRLVSAMDNLNESKIHEYQRNIFNNVKKIYKLNSKGIVYDVTNTYFHGKTCGFGEKGKSKDGKRQNDLIQIGLATTQKEGIPVFHKSFNGNIHDSRTLMSLSGSFSEYRLNSGLFVYDRGITSEKKLNSIGKMGWKTLCGLTMREKEKNAIRKLLKKGSMDQFSNMVQINGNVIYVKGIPHKFGSIKGKLAICYNETKRIEIKESRRNKIVEAQKLINENKEILIGLDKYLTSTGRLREFVLQNAEEFDGYSCIFCTKNIPDEDMVRLYYDKDIIEKAFRTLKGVSKLRPIRFRLKKRVETHVFICYLSYLILSILKLNLKSKGIDISSEKAIEDLEDMYNVYFCDNKKKNKFIRSVTLSKHQERILRSVGSNVLKNHVIRP